MEKKIKVIVVDDSALMRAILVEALNSDPLIDVVDTASDPIIAREKIKIHNPDVITLDIEMPRMNGLDFLQKIMSLRPMPVVMISTLTQAGAEATFRALEIGCVDFVGKPSGLMADGIALLREEIIAKVKIAAKSRMRTIGSKAIALGSKPKSQTMLDRVIAIGASTGGVPIIGEILSQMPANAPPILITQHMPASFTGRFAARLNSLCDMTVMEACEAQEVLAGNVYIAPGGKQMRLIHKGSKRLISLKVEDKINGFCPSVDILFDSVALTEKKAAIGAILTGMGHDGARGLLRLRQSGADTLGQDEDSSLIYGMPRLAFEMGAVMQQISAKNIAKEILRLSCTV